MRISFILLFVLLLIVQLKAQFIDDFSDGDFSSNPEWTGQVSNFIVSSGELQLFAPEVEDESYLVTASKGLDNGTWEFSVRMDFGTSGSNFTRVYLMSSNEQLTGSLEGYYVLIGETEDEISLYRQDGQETVVLIDGVDKLIDTNPVAVRIRVTRDNLGNWELLHDITGGTGFTSAGTAIDNTYRITDFFGIRCTYTSSRYDLFFFDDFNVTGDVILDTEPPQILRAEALSSTQVLVQFSENIDPSSVDVGSLSINQGISVQSVETSDAELSLETSAMTNGRTYTLSISSITDEVGNEILPNSSVDFRYLEFAMPAREDILLTEVLFNPRTEAVDFVELYNNSDLYFDLSQFFLARIDDDTLDQVRQIGEGEELVFSPRQYLALSEDSSILAFEYPQGNTSNFVTIDDVPSYNDDEGTVVLLSPELDTLQFFKYSEDYHYELLEDEEGVSLERITLSGNENDPNLWRSAASAEGFATPGKANSQNLIEGQAVGKLTIDPKVFIPGNAGTGRDYTTINYELNSTGQFANVQIYDQSGRPVKQLANGASLSTTGFFRWDGTTDQGGIARMGYHIIVFELYDDNGNTEILRETVVVGRDF